MRGSFYMALNNKLKQAQTAFNPSPRVMVWDWVLINIILPESIIFFNSIFLLNLVNPK